MAHEGAGKESEGNPLLGQVGRFAARGMKFLGVVAMALGDLTWKRTAGSSIADHSRAAWAHRWGGRMLKSLGLDLRVEGNIPDGGLLVCNHLSYLDIVVLSALAPATFVSKAEVARWPVLGTLARCAGTLFLDRRRKGDVARVGEALMEKIRQGGLVVLFPEGTSSDGARVLPFHSSLFQAAVAQESGVHLAALGYEVDGGNAAEDVCYWGDMTFLPHFLKLLTRRRILARVVFGSHPLHGADRRDLAKRCHSQVVRLHQLLPLRRAN